MSLLYLAKIAFETIKDKNSRDPVVFDVSKVSGYTEYIMIVTGSSSRQIASMADEIEDKMSQAGFKVIGTEGKSKAEWILLDFGSIVVHLFQKTAREYYQLDTLWADCPVVFSVNESTSS
jgi:ribosome-associated protein